VFANNLKQVVRSQYGTAGPEFVRSLLEEYAVNPEFSEALQEEVEKVTEELMVSDLEPAQARVLRRFALYQLAGDLAVQWGILPFTEADVTEAILHVRDLWLEGSQEISDTARGLDRLRSFVLRYCGGFVSIRNRTALHTNAKGFYNPEQNLYLFNDEQLREASGGVDPGEIAKELRSLGFLIVHEDGRLKVKQKLAWLDGKWVRFYAVRSSFIGEQDTADEPDLDNAVSGSDLGHGDLYDF
jgi:putative DNA primase/helicase